MGVGVCDRKRACQMVRVGFDIKSLHRWKDVWEIVQEGDCMFSGGRWERDGEFVSYKDGTVLDLILSIFYSVNIMLH